MLHCSTPPLYPSVTVFGIASSVPLSVTRCLLQARVADNPFKSGFTHQCLITDNPIEAAEARAEEKDDGYNDDRASNSSAEVIGIDLSPLQPPWVPPNLRFLVNDLEDEWIYLENHFDYIHVRHTLHSIRKPAALMERAMK